MAHRNRPLRFVNLVVLLVVLGAVSSGCASTSPPRDSPGTVTPAPSPVADEAVGGADSDTCTPDMSRATHWSRDAAEHKAAFLQAYTLATVALEAQVPTFEPERWAVALDADETILDNSLYQKEREAECKGYTSESWRAWVMRREAKALPGAQAFLRRVDELGGVIAVVTNRDEAECPATMDNFRALDLPFDLMLCQTGPGEKEPRWETVQKGTASPEYPPLKIVMWVGDNIMDFPDLDQSVRDKGAEAFKEFGTRFFLVPNPMYGSWQRNPKE